MGMKHWKNIKSDEKVRETKTGWKVGNDDVYWEGKEAATAHKWLHKRALRDKRKK